MNVLQEKIRKREAALENIMVNIEKALASDKFITKEELNVVREGLKDIIINKKAVSDVFKVIGTGCYKICSEPLKGWVLKFIIEENETEEEEVLYAEAKARGLDFIFPETYFWEIPKVVRKDWIDMDEDDFITLPCEYCGNYGCSQCNNSEGEEGDYRSLGGTDGFPDLYTPPNHIISHICLQRKVDYIWRDKSCKLIVENKVVSPLTLEERILKYEWGKKTVC